MSVRSMWSVLFKFPIDLLSVCPIHTLLHIFEFSDIENETSPESQIRIGLAI